MKLLKNTVIALGNKAFGERFVYFALGNLDGENNKIDTNADIQEMQSLLLKTMPDIEENLIKKEDNKNVLDKDGDAKEFFKAAEKIPTLKKIVEQLTERGILDRNLEIDGDIGSFTKLMGAYAMFQNDSSSITNIDFSDDKAKEFEFAEALKPVLEAFVIEETKGGVKILDAEVKRIQTQEKLIGKNYKNMQTVLSWKSGKRQEIVNQLPASQKEEIIGEFDKFRGKTEQNKKLYAYLKGLSVEDLSALLNDGYETMIASRNKKEAVETQTEKNKNATITKKKVKTVKDLSKEYLKSTTTVEETMKNLYEEGGLYEMLEKNVDGNGMIQLSGFMKLLLANNHKRKVNDETQRYSDHTKEFIKQKGLEDKTNNVLKALTTLGINPKENLHITQDIAVLILGGMLPIVHIRTQIINKLVPTLGIEKATRLATWIEDGAEGEFDPESSGKSFQELIQKTRVDHSKLIKAGQRVKYLDKEAFDTLKDELKENENSAKRLVKIFTKEFGESADEARRVLFNLFERFGKSNREVKDNLEIIYNENGAATIEKQLASMDIIYDLLEQERIDDAAFDGQFKIIEKPFSVKGKTYYASYNHNRIHPKLSGKFNYYEEIDGKKVKLDHFSSQLINEIPVKPSSSQEKYLEAKIVFEGGDSPLWKEIATVGKNQNKKYITAPLERNSILAKEYNRQATSLEYLQIKAVADIASTLGDDIDKYRLYSVLSQYPEETLFDRFTTTESVKNLLNGVRKEDGTFDIGLFKDVAEKEEVKKYLRAIQFPETYTSYYHKEVLKEGRILAGKLTPIENINKFKHGSPLVIPTENANDEDKALIMKRNLDKIIKETPDKKPDEILSTEEHILRGISEHSGLELSRDEFSTLFMKGEFVDVDQLPKYVKNTSRESWDMDRFKELPEGDTKVLKLPYTKTIMVPDENGKLLKATLSQDIYLRPECANYIATPAILSIDGAVIEPIKLSDNLEPLEYPTEENLRKNYRIPIGPVVWSGLVGLLLKTSPSTGKVCDSLTTEGSDVPSKTTVKTFSLK